jgi:hypothetical protein
MVICKRAGCIPKRLHHLQVAAVLEDGCAEPVAADDAAEVLWAPVQDLRGLQGNPLSYLHIPIFTDVPT